MRASNKDKGAAGNDYMNWRNGLYSDFASIIPNIVELIIGEDRINSEHKVDHITTTYLVLHAISDHCAPLHLIFQCVI